jgi:hypothetical protein
MRQEAVLTPSEIEILQQGVDDPNVVTDYFFRQQGSEHGWLFDDNFAPEGAWQRTVHEAEQKDITVIGGFGTGKTLGIAMSACVWALLTKDFKFLNIAEKAWQAKQMYDLVLLWARNTRFEDLIWEQPRKPFPKIILRYRIGKTLYESSLEFMSADRDATGILSWEGDWLNIEEAGLLDNLEDIIINVGSRLRGSVKGRERLGRFSMISNSWDNFHLWYYFDQAMADPTNFLSLVVSTRHNKNVTEEQLKRMVARIPPEERERFIEGTRPEGRGNYFDRQSVYACEDPFEFGILQKNVQDDIPGYAYEKMHGAGITYYTMPPVAGRIYLGFGDPGIGAAPQRNAPVLMIWDATDFPTLPARLVAFYWGDGGGKIAPFVDRMLNFAEAYKPVRFYIDSTGPQKNSAQLINEHIFRKRFAQKKNPDDLDALVDDPGYASPLGMVRGIHGMDFSGGGKNAYLVCCRLFIESRLLQWAKEITGIRSQLTNYDAERDKKIAQDIVACMSMSAYGIRGFFHVNAEDLLARSSQEIKGFDFETRRLSTAGRSRRSAHAHEAQSVPR